MGDGLTKYLILGLGLFLALLPIIIAETRGRLALQFATFLLCGLGVVVLVAGGVVLVAGGIATGGGAGLSLIVTLPVAAGLWFAALFCGLAVWADARHERRNRETVLRLLTNDARGLGDVEDYHPRRFWK